MTLTSINKEKIYFVINNPCVNKGVMEAKDTCIGCTFHDEVYDKLEGRYSHYCWLFGVWHPDGPTPNEICNYHLRGRNDKNEY